MSTAPLLSYIVLSYNYEHYIDSTIRSILEQTVQDFEIVVVDDCSRDNSVRVVRSFGDPRIRILQNEQNMGGAASYNRAVEAARGKWLVNLDADDWIASDKAEVQLAAVEKDPSLDVIGTYVAFFDQDGGPHEAGQQLEAIVNQQHELDRVDTWIGANHLCRSSTMVRRDAHLRIGLDDATMVRAPDYELWTRALREGCKFAIVPERLTSMRLHSSGVTHADPLGSFLEMTYAMLRNLIPLAEQRAFHPSIARIITWVCRHHELSRLLPEHGYRLIGLMMEPLVYKDFASFKAAVFNVDERAELAAIGRRCLSLFSPGAGPYQEISRLHKDIEAYLEARDYWRAESDKWQGAFLQATGAAR
ncbi:glycosyltransferase family 2 protein [Paraburkholderia dilworthii]|uniref:Glycosyltransferase family 2 protein n=1 Tax=Paraburkholderia dilworthii TaxID=948106 RepID=A0ABW9DHY6_9BURK